MRALLQRGVPTRAYFSPIHLQPAHDAPRSAPAVGAQAHNGCRTTAAEEPARVSVVVAAKDEEANIEACLRSVLAQDHPRFELLVVNDRSTDATGTILQRLSEEFGGRMRVLTVERLPEGWGGQNHALRQGVSATSGEWLCFTDADCRWDSPRTLAVACAETLAHRADLFSLLPRMEAPTIWEKLYVPVCCLVFLMRLRLGDVNRADRPAAYANGAFMMARRAAYEALGGHERVRGEVNDDVALARHAKAAGYRVRVAGNSGLVRTRMYGSPRQAWNGWTRNFLGTLQSGRALAAALAATLALFVLPWAGFAACAALALRAGPSWNGAALAWGAALLATHAGMWVVYATFGCPAAASLLYLAGAIFVAGVAASALGRAVRKTRTVWHGARY
ncbi:MAG TPA: glycosyltransferase family A protein [Myxococcota bacterium]|jgi:chlorobactene glucosyltransferase|nr:glycosyltransferase family A protein [Myxococcota bacterium]